MNEHVWTQIGTRDDEGYRTFDIPGDVCAGCSDPENGKWVPVSDCNEAWWDLIWFEYRMNRMLDDEVS